MGRGKHTKWNKGVFFAIVIAAFGVAIVILLVVIEVQKTNSNVLTLWENIVTSVLCSIVASIIYTIMQRGFSDNDDKQIVRQLQQIEQSLQRQNELYDSGIISIHPKTHFDNEESYWNNIINGTNKRLDLIGHSISNWFRREYKLTFITKLKQIIESENSVNIVLSASDVNLEDVREVLCGRKRENELNKVEKTLLNFCRLLKEIPKDKHQYLKVYINDFEKVTYLYIRTDEQCIISPYVYSMDNNNNSFLLELRPRTSYVKSIEDDFEEMISDLDQVDLPFDEYRSDLNKMYVLYCEKTQNRYSGSNWNFEKTEKYIYGDGDRKYEVGYFEHYLDKQYIKSVIELPVSYGCPSRCQFCASSNIQDFGMLRACQMLSMFNDIYTSKELSKREMVLLSVTGMGDLYFNEDNVFTFLLSLTEYNNLSITLSSSFWDSKLIERAVSLKSSLSIRFIQLTYISDKEEVISKIVPLHTKREKLPSVFDFIEYIDSHEENFFRINYVVISDVNDSDEDVRRFIDNILKIKEKIIIRVSKMNETNATKRNSLNTVSIDKLKRIRDILANEGIKSYIFYSYKNDNMNCGQLLTELP